eukprot:TRINITY_DN14507_c0_g1_i1.p1 TRINITY_DN14507_c0_g1~~TRINITY_DN14507_c0_g1_i1.p1  ORF type:complete len:281 (+),score=88.69 TRINITY_DN14507_c0_g1_i1:87-845(+)
MARPPSFMPQTEAMMQRDRREKLRELAMQTLDLAKDPYFLRNHLGHYECRLCLTIHNTEGNYLAHTQGKRHQTNLLRREAQQKEQIGPQAKRRAVARNTVKIGLPAYQVQKKRTASGGGALNFQIHYPEIEEGITPRHRFMSAFEQRKETPDRRWQYLLFAAEPYETIAFKIPNEEVEQKQGFHLNWNKDKFMLTLEFQFKQRRTAEPGDAAGTALVPVDDGGFESSGVYSAPSQQVQQDPSGPPPGLPPPA